MSVIGRNRTDQLIERLEREIRDVQAKGRTYVTIKATDAESILKVLRGQELPAESPLRASEGPKSGVEALGQLTFLAQNPDAILFGHPEQVRTCLGSIHNVLATDLSGLYKGFTQLQNLQDDGEGLVPRFRGAQDTEDVLRAWDRVEHLLVERPGRAPRLAPAFGKELHYWESDDPGTPAPGTPPPTGPPPEVSSPTVRAQSPASDTDTTVVFGPPRSPPHAPPATAYRQPGHGAPGVYGTPESSQGTIPAKRAASEELPTPAAKVYGNLDETDLRTAETVVLKLRGTAGAVHQQNARILEGAVATYRRLNAKAELDDFEQEQLSLAVDDIARIQAP